MDIEDIARETGIPQRWPENVRGPYFTTTNCVDCGNCSRHATGFFARRSFPNHWYVTRQPKTPEEIEKMEKALKYCKGKAIVKIEN